MKIALVTGASAGFGFELVKMLDNAGYSVILAARRDERLKELQKGLKNESLILKLDVRDKNAVFKAAQDIDEKWKNIEILVNNAGLALGQEPFESSDLNDFEIMIDTNIKGLLYTTKAFLPFIKKGGIIFNLGSVAGAWPYAGGHVYGGTKAFVKQFGYALRNDLRGREIRVTTIAPGIAKTEFSEVRFKGDKAKADAVYNGTEYLSAKDVAKVICDVAALPKHVNINYLEVMPTTQSWAGFHFERE